jgi:putative serine protease PepD
LADRPPASPPLFDPPGGGIGPDRPPHRAPFGALPDPPRPDAPPAAPRSLRGPIALAAAIGALVAVLVTAFAFVVFDDDGGDPLQVVAPPAGPNVTLGGDELDIQGVLSRVQASVVSIETGQSSLGAFGAGAGSGVVIDASGLVLTNAHVIANADSIDVVLFDGTTVSATMLGSFPDDDVALIQLDEAVEGLTPATLGSSESLRVGDDVVAIGNALDLGGQPSVTQGIVSALDRSVDDGNLSLRDLIQTDAAINPGNSGGPLVDARGEVVGINTAIIDQAQNIGFAISIDSVEPLIDQIREGEADITPDSAFLGISSQDVAVTPEVDREEFGVDVDEGAFVVRVEPGTAAAELGLQEGDVITDLDGEAVTTSDDVATVVRSHEAGDEITVEWRRDGEAQSGTATLGCRSGNC